MPDSTEIRPETPAGPFVRVTAYEGTEMLFDQLVHQNVAHRQIFTKYHYRPDGTSLTVVVELPENYSQFPSVEAGPDLASVNVYDLLVEIRRRIEPSAAEHNDQEASDGG